MTSLLSIHRKLQYWQEKRNARLLLTAILSIAVLALLIPTLFSTYQLYETREEIFTVLIGPDSRIAAEQIEETGFLTLHGKDIGDVRLKGFKFLDEEGRVINPADATSLLIRSSIPRWIPTWLLRDPNLIWIGGSLALGWCISSVWLGLFFPFLYSILLGTTSWFVFRALGLPDVSLVIVGMCILGYSYHLILQIFRFLLRSPRQVPAIARGVLLEATRTRMSIAFLTILLIALPLIPIMLDPESPLRHRVQTMLSRSLGMTFVIAALLTVFLGCATVAFEIRDRQIWQVLTKPVSKLGYLFGKWLGIVSLNFAILTIAGLSVFMYLQYMRTAPVAEGLQGELDRLAVEEEILTAREETLPIYETLTNEQISFRVDELIEADSELRDIDQIQVLLRQKLREEVQEEFLDMQRAIPANIDGEAFSHSYTFKGLKQAKKLGTPLTFKYKFYIGAADEQETYEAGFVYNGDLNTRHKVTYVPTMTHVTMVPAYLIDDNGELTITIYNLLQPDPNYYYKGTMRFDKDGIQLLYRVGNFESNFFRALLVLLIKLSFLAALAIAASTFLSFPVACMITLTVFASGTLSPYLSQSLEYYFPPSTSDFDFSNIGITIQWAFEHTVHAIASAMVFCLSGFGSQRPTNELVNGMLVSWGTVLQGFLTIGVIWSGAVLGAGTLILKKRQLAIYSGKG